MGEFTEQYLLKFFAYASGGVFNRYFNAQYALK